MSKAKSRWRPKMYPLQASSRRPAVAAAFPSRTRAKPFVISRSTCWSSRAPSSASGIASDLLRLFEESSPMLLPCSSKDDRGDLPWLASDSGGPPALEAPPVRCFGSTSGSVLRRCSCCGGLGSSAGSAGDGRPLLPHCGGSSPGCPRGCWRPSAEPEASGAPSDLGLGLCGSADGGPDGPRGCGGALLSCLSGGCP